MSVRNRVAQLRAAVAGHGSAGQAFMVVWESADRDGGSSRPPGVYRRGNVVEVVHEGDEPSAALRAWVRELAPAALEIVLGLAVVPPPAESPWPVYPAEASDHGRRP